MNGIYYDLVVRPYDMVRTFICALWSPIHIAYFAVYLASYAQYMLFA